jgi:class 3 adenylate cyclase/pimeloyl-ACP methyl ester carboxylesterase
MRERHHRGSVPLGNGRSSGDQERSGTLRRWGFLTSSSSSPADIRSRGSSGARGRNLLVVPALISNVEVSWEHEFYRRTYELAGEYAHVVQFDKRGVGLSDKITAAHTLDERIGDILAVLDAAGIERTSLLGLSEGGLMAQLFAAKHPERVDKLVLTNSAPGATIYRQLGLLDRSREVMHHFNAVFADWGRDARGFLEWFSPTNADNEAFIRWASRFQRLSSTEAEIRRQLGSIARLDAYELLPDITAETLVMNARGEQVIPPETGEALSARIPGATHRYFESDNHFCWLGDEWLEVLTPIIKFVTGTSVERASERRFATVVFTDIVGSTTATIEVGDDRWRELLDRHDQLAFDVCDDHGGEIVKSTGDGLLVRFDVPTAGISFARDFRRRVGDIGLAIRAGVHSGEIEVRANRDITGVAVNLAARVEQAASDGAVFASSTVRDMLLGGSVDFQDRGNHELKGFDDSWHLYELAD